jgi:hypothetical protein
MASRNEDRLIAGDRVKGYSGSLMNLTGVVSENQTGVREGTVRVEWDEGRTSLAPESNLRRIPSTSSSSSQPVSVHVAPGPPRIAARAVVTPIGSTSSPNSSDSSDSDNSEDSEARGYQEKATQRRFRIDDDEEVTIIVRNNFRPETNQARQQGARVQTAANNAAGAKPGSLGRSGWSGCRTSSDTASVEDARAKKAGQPHSSHHVASMARESSDSQFAKKSGISQRQGKVVLAHCARAS